LKIAILVEGKTEKAFFPSLRSFLAPRLPGKMPNIDPVVYDGRIPKTDKLQRTVRILLSSKRAADAVIALSDVYTGTPDFSNAADAKQQMRAWVGGIQNFYPHVALHDFEAWLVPYWSRILQLAKHNQGQPTGAPETINHNKPPSAIISDVFERGQCRDSYSKARDAQRILRDQDLGISIAACPELKAFVNRILGLAGGQQIP